MIRALVGILATTFLASFSPRVFDEDGWCIPQSNADAALCGKPLTGCICVVSGGTISVASFDNCEGCYYSFSGFHITCGTSSSTMTTCSGDVSCNTVASCAYDCPCTHGVFYPFTLSCGSCTE